MKFDGYRLMASIGGGRVTCHTRTGLDWTEKFAGIAAALSELDCDNALIDGEAVAAADGGSQFSALQKALKHGGDTVFYAFDLLHLDGKDTATMPLVERKALLKSLLAGSDGRILKFSEHVRGHAGEVYRRMCGAGQEGIISKRADAPYRSGRTGNWLKIKCTHRQEFVIGGYAPSDKRGRPFASILLGTYDNGRLDYRGRVGTGFSDETMTELAALFAERVRKASPFVSVPDEYSRGAVWLRPDLVAEVDFAEFTDDGHVRHGSFEGLRKDKEARTVVLEQPKKKDTDNDAEPSPPATRRAGKAPAPTRSASDGNVVAGITISHPERVLFKEDDVTKLDLARYHAAAAPRMLQYAADHPVSLLRCPGGDIAHCFFQKHAGDGFPEEIRQVPIRESSGKTENYMTITDEKSLVAAVQMGTMEFHIWGASTGTLEQPDRIIFDLDPDESVGFDDVKEASTELRDVLGAVGLQTVPLVTGGKGVHVIVPLLPEADWNDVKTFAKALSQRLADARPDRYVTTMSKARRKGRIFIDWLRNERGATAVAPYSTRARKGGPVATPVTWNELSTLEAANVFTIPVMMHRLAEPDPWAEAARWKQALTGSMVSAVAGK